MGCGKESIGKSDRRIRIVHPVVMIPFLFIENSKDHLISLFDFLGKLLSGLGHEQPWKFCPPIFVANEQTYLRIKTDADLCRNFNEVISKASKLGSVLKVWSVDTCQMWLAGLGRASYKAHDDDVCWLIPGDFNYAEPEARQQGLPDMQQLPEAVCSDKCKVAIGEITIDSDNDNSKHLIDTYGTYGLLFTWFKQEAIKISNLTKRPRTEFFAMTAGCLKELLAERWFPYEQTLFILLHAVRKGWELANRPLRGLLDESLNRENLPGAIEQIERTERALKMYWREYEAGKHNNWPDRYRSLDKCSEEIRRSALTVLAQHLSL
jgi:hypothetical protein